ncbi:MAG: calcium-binding protein, partial [Alphaproteobacteria bacterium]|nr:calcium-binding protein [Alphaproteobacteria bacterium]
GLSSFGNDIYFKLADEAEQAKSDEPEGDDTLLGGDGNDWLYGGDGDDDLHGGAGWDYLFGGTGNDFLYGGDNSDYLFGGAGADVLDGGADNDYGFGNRDTASYINSASGVKVKLSGTGSGGDAEGDTLINIENLVGSEHDDYLFGDTGDNVISGYNGNDRIYGGDGNDELNGGDGNDRIYGGAGKDDLDGGDGNDRLSGGDGNDWLHGGGGSDLLEGGKGGDWLWGDEDTDTFVYNTGDGVDLIWDFTQGEDKIELSYDGIADWGDLSGYISSDSDDTVITFSEDDSILLVHVDAASLEASDFAFA